MPFFLGNPNFRPSELKNRKPDRYQDLTIEYVGKISRFANTYYDSSAQWRSNSDNVSRDSFPINTYPLLRILIVR